MALDGFVTVMPNIPILLKSVLAHNLPKIGLLINLFVLQ
jgi:hypothetical protein